ncbi:MAG: multidrug efflux SMR transporter [Candidatus Nanopelagicales bacterium]|jgi:quaternary ammonium compound-resistance protein SugE|nr:multidrug efflux SMR transporter [Candidatus Nanopelagicales bacterium]
MAWLLLIVAGLLETVFAVSLKLSDGFTRLGWVLLFLVSASASFGLLAMALRSLPVGTAYAVWTGIGAVGTAIVGMIAFRDPVTAGRLVSLVLVVVGLVGLQLTSSQSGAES